MIIIDSNVWIFSEYANADEHDDAAGNVMEIFESDTFGINVVIASEVYNILSKLLGTKEARRRVGAIVVNYMAIHAMFSLFSERRL